MNKLKLIEKIHGKHERRGLGVIISRESILTRINNFLDNQETSLYKSSHKNLIDEFISDDDCNNIFKIEDKMSAEIYTEQRRIVTNTGVLIKGLLKDHNIEVLCGISIKHLEKDMNNKEIEEMNKFLELIMSLDHIIVDLENPEQETIKFISKSKEYIVNVKLYIVSENDTTENHIQFVMKKNLLRDNPVTFYTEDESLENPNVLKVMNLYLRRDVLYT